ncbi:hypothetical protein BJ508DRAFT_332718 [Ascobolus immersus RN42]|uniref:Uncharacterized protein n=1 Tax=Ascobolus immersus RN42 TaxID=1160509 RepID=A0A3N4HLR8_ASCIM|nr:hypothetical protein BJ508DRAFT_332718 [Ascobolus immersus RN42]
MHSSLARLSLPARSSSCLLTLPVTIISAPISLPAHRRLLSLETRIAPTNKSFLQRHILSTHRASSSVCFFSLDRCNIAARPGSDTKSKSTLSAYFASRQPYTWIAGGSHHFPSIGFNFKLIPGSTFHSQHRSFWTVRAGNQSQPVLWRKNHATGRFVVRAPGTAGELSPDGRGSRFHRVHLGADTMLDPSRCQLGLREARYCYEGPCLAEVFDEGVVGIRNVLVEAGDGMCRRDTVVIVEDEVAGDGVPFCLGLQLTTRSPTTTLSEETEVFIPKPYLSQTSTRPASFSSRVLTYSPPRHPHPAFVHTLPSAYRSASTLSHPRCFPIIHRKKPSVYDSDQINEMLYQINRFSAKFIMQRPSETDMLSSEELHDIYHRLQAILPPLSKIKHKSPLSAEEYARWRAMDDEEVSIYAEQYSSIPHRGDCAWFG